MIGSPSTIEALRQKLQSAQTTDPLCMPWPMHNPVVLVPHFSHEVYKAVNLNAPASEHSSGLDLPLQDITTLRFFYNLGVQQARAALLAQYNELTRSKTQQQLPPQPAPRSAFSPFTNL